MPENTKKTSGNPAAKLAEELRDFEARLKSNRRNAELCKASCQPVPFFLSTDIDFCESEILALSAQLGKGKKS